MAPSLDPTDPKYQISPDFPPDKETTWKYPKEKDGWCLVHGALKAEIRMFAEAYEFIQARDVYKKQGLLEWEINSIQTAFAGHFDHVHWHHTDEDDTVVPFWKNRFKYPEKLEVAHPVIEAQIDKIKKIIEGFKPGDKIEGLASEWKIYEEMIVPHMDEEEALALPLYRAYFSAADMAPVIAEIIKNAPKIEMGSAAHVMGPDKFRSEFMVQEGIPFFVWHIDFKYRLAEFERRVVKHIEALKSGQEPVEKPRCAIL